MENRPPIVKPILLNKKDAPFDDPAWIYELKYDGFRGVLHVFRNECFFISKSGKVMGKRFQRFAERLGTILKQDSLVIDGEIAVLDPKTGRPIFHEVQRVDAPLVYVTFDLMYLNGTDLRESPLIDRKKKLRAIARGKSNVLYLEHTDGIGTELFAAASVMNLEGIVAKRKLDPYRRNVTWYKIMSRCYKR
jgi:bifunctional non-homologous end joining protein LigD